MLNASLGKACDVTLKLLMVYFSQFFDGRWLLLDDLDLHLAGVALLVMGKLRSGLSSFIDWFIGEGLIIWIITGIFVHAWSPRKSLLSVSIEIFTVVNVEPYDLAIT